MQAYCFSVSADILTTRSLLSSVLTCYIYAHVLGTEKCAPGAQACSRAP